ncbi:MAG: acylphosphatase [Anaerolineae bacterium]|nr:acylphosphatase [Anaerolineae bacterium]
MESQEICRLHTLIEGHVQGVGFRFFVQARAEKLGIKGWVRNTYDGSVEVVAEGPRETLETLLQDLRTGPPAAWVTQVKINWSAPTGEFRSFSVERTA